MRVCLAVEVTIEVHRQLDRRVAHLLLYVVRRRSAVQQQARECMAQVVRPAPLQACAFQYREVMPHGDVGVIGDSTLAVTEYEPGRLRKFTPQAARGEFLCPAEPFL